MWRKILLILVPLIVLGIALTGAHLLVERLFILMILLLIMSYLVARLGTRGLRGNLRIPEKHYQAGQLFQVEAIAENTSFWPKPFLQLKIQTGEKSRDRDILVNIASKGTYSWQNNLSFSRRGRYHLGPLTGEATDMFGLFRFSRKLDNVKDVLIYPPTVELPLFLINSQSEPGLLHSEWLSDETAGTISGVREYVPGDSLNRIHWRSTAHLGKLIVKEFDIDLSEKIWLILDLNKESNFGTGTETTEEYGVMAAASIVKKYTDAGRHVGMIAQGGDYHFYPARQGEPNMGRIMEALAICSGCGRIPFHRILTGASRQMSSNSVAIIITASTRSEVVNSILKLKKQGIQTVAILLDATTFGGNGSIQDTEKRLRAAKVAVYIVKKGDNLSEALSNQDNNLKAKPVAEVRSYAW
jgi:uncharacterized protein (DUF58 family)